MKDIKTSAAALRALVELGYPLELSRVVDYLKNLDSKDELLQFDNEEGLCNFLQKYPTMFWVEGGKVFPAQMKPKGRPSPQTQQSQPKAQGVSNSTDKATHLEQKVDKVETLEGDEKKNRNLDSADIAKLREDSIKAIAAVLKREGPTRLKALLKYAHKLPPEVRSFVGKEEESIISFILEQPDVFFIDDNDIVFHVSTVHKEATQEFKLVLQSRGQLHVDRLTGHISSFKHKYAILWFIGGSPSDVEKFLKGYPNVFRVDDNGTVSLINAKTKQPASACSGEKATTKDTTTKVAVDSLSNKTSKQLKTSKENKLLEEGVKHFRDVLQVKGSMPIERLFGHVNQCRDEVKRAIGTKENEVETFLYKYPEVFSISRKGNVYLVSSNAKQQQVNPGKDKLLANPKTKQCKESVAIKEEGVKHFKKVLESKGSLHIKSLCGHSGQYKYVDPMLKIIGGGPSSVMDFLKGFPNMFSIGDDGMVHLTSQSQANKPGTENRSYAMVVETGQKVQAKAADSSHLQDNIKGKSASSTAVVGTHDKTAGKAKKESILLEGVQHFKQVLESKGSMPLKNIFGHVNQCRNQVKWAIGSSMDNVKKFLLKYPEVFYVDKKMVVHLVCNRAKEQQQEQNKTNNKQLQIEEKALAHFTEMLSRKGPSTTHVLSSCFSSCGEDIRRHVGNSKEGLIKFFRKHPQIFKVDADEIVYLKSTGSMHIQSMVFKPQRWASCDTLTVPCDTVFPKVLSKLSGSTPDVRSAVGGGTLQQEEEVKDKPSQQDRKDKNETGDGTSTCTSMPCPQTQHTPDQKADSSKKAPDKFISAVKDILSKKGSLHVVQLFEELGTMLPHERFELSGVRLLLKKCPEDFHVNDQDIVEELPPMNVFAVVNKMLGNNSCFATMEDTSIVYVHIALYRERMGVDCTRLQDHLSTGDILLVDTEHGTPGSSSKWTATNIRAVFKSPKSVDADKNGVNFQTPMPFLPATTIVRSPSEICGAIVKLVASSTLHVKDLSSRMKYLNHDAVLYLREKGGLLSFLQSQPQLFLVQDKCVSLVAGEGELDEGTSQCLASPGARCTIGEVSVISKNIAHLRLPDDKEAILDLTDSITTSHLSVGDCLVAYINIVPSNQSEIPWVVSEVKHVMGKAVPAQIRAKTATPTCGSDRLKEAPQQSVLEGEQQQMEDQTDQENNQQEPGQKLDRAEIEKETLELIVNLVQKSGQVSLRSLQGHINLLGEEKHDCIKDKGGLLTFLQHHYGTIFEINSTSESVSLRQKQDVQRTEPDFLTSSSAEEEQLQPKRLTVEEEVDKVGPSLEKTSVPVDISDAENNKEDHNPPMKETGDDIATSLLKTRHNTEECDDVDISTVVTPSVLVAQETDIVHTPNPLLEQYLNEKETVCDSFGLPTATVHPVVPVDSPPGQPDDDFTSLLHMFKDNLSPIQDNLVEVEMDIGRIPIARYYNPASPNLLAPLRLSEETLTRETLETILSALPLDRSATGQGRVLLRGSLHWVSTLKNSSDDIVGLTLRRGQAVPGCLDLLWDMVTSGTSTLIIGRPCSGKTTLLREWARVLSDVCYRRVIVVDTLNEIAGGDDVPHPGVGGARRVQVHNRCQQVSQLQTAARNHSPDCIIVDEVQTLEEGTALQAIRLTGIQVIAGVCAGCLPDLLHNSVMRGLLGMSDPPSTASASRGVGPQTPTFPHSLPVFQAAVQIHNRDNLSVYSDVASFVRMSLLEGRFPLAQQRKRVVTNGRQTEL